MTATAPPPAPETPAPSEPLRSVHTTNFPQFLEQLGISLLVSTYQSGKLITVRSDAGTLNTHFRDFQSPMGLAADPARLAVGTKTAVWDFRNVPDVARKLEPAGKHDACYLPRNVHTTGDIRVHELAFAAGELWLVNTAFSCLCTLDADHSFVPRWRPPFVTALSPDDRCHLNGLAIVDGRPRYVTALGQTDKGGTWRENKASGGCVIDVTSNRVLIDGLAMPHSPRWHSGRLWVLESGKGSLGWLDPASGRLQTLATLPGFTRGLAFAGPVAFVGLSQVRETAVFGGLPITERPTEERVCGVWAVHLETGKSLGFLRFEGQVQEIFDVQVLAGLRFPEVATLEDPHVASSYVLPAEALKQVAPS